MRSQKDNFIGSNKVGRGAGNLQKQILNLQKFLELLQQDSIKELCDLLGKLTKAQKKLELESYTISRTYNLRTPTPYVKEEISGVVLGRDIENILPQELALIDDKDFSILFDVKFAENRLFCFEKQGYEDTIHTEEIEKEREKEAEDIKGPIILCVDTSGSMSGTPEQIAKAIALFMAKRAMEQKRACYLVNFSTEIHTLDLSAPCGLFTLMEFLSMSFSGGTDSIPALEAGMQKMKEEGYAKADLLLISDFIFSDNDKVKIKELLDSKDESNKCYALYIGDFHKSSLQQKVFDDEFIYNERNHSVENLARFTRECNTITN